MYSVISRKKDMMICSLRKISRLGGLGTSKDFMEVNLKHQSNCWAKLLELFLRWRATKN